MKRIYELLKQALSSKQSAEAAYRPVYANNQRERKLPVRQSTKLK